MKKYIENTFKITPMIAFLLLAVSCKDFLEERPTSFINPSTFFQTAKDAEAAVIGGYNHLGASNAGTYGWWRDFTFEILTDDFDTRPAATANDSRNVGLYVSFNPGSSLVGSIYENYTEGINTFTVAIDGITGMDDFEGKEALIAEAKFLRAYSYFTLVRTFGRVPLIEQPLTAKNAANLPRVASTDEIYALIISDLEAGSALPEQASLPGRATKWAAMSLLAKVYLTIENWPEAARLAKAVIENSDRELLPVYADIFREDNENNKESIFEIQMDIGDESSNQVGNWPRGIGAGGDQDYFLGPNWGGLYIATEDLISDFEPNDVRRELISTSVTRNDGTVIEFNADGVTPHYSIKRTPASYIEGKEANNNSGYNFIYLRLGEVYLIAAEAENEANGPANAYPYINAIRQRAGLPALDGLSQDAFRTAVRKERRTELFDERNRLFDLYRWNNLVERIKTARPNAQPQPFQTTWPIPISAMNLNPLLDQNAGY